MRRMCVLMAAVISTGCATVQVQKERLSATKRVAIIGYSGFVELEEEEASGIAATVGAIKGANDAASGKLDARRIEQAQASYARLAKRLSEAVGWVVVDRPALTENASYAQLLQQYPNEGLKVLGVQRLPDVLRAEPALALGQDARKALVAALGVDAIAVVRVHYSVGRQSGFSVGGLGNTTTFPKALVEFTVYDGRGDEPVWRDVMAQGEPTSEGLEMTMGAAIVANETEVLTEAAAGGFEVLLERFHGAQAAK